MIIITSKESIRLLFSQKCIAFIRHKYTKKSLLRCLLFENIIKWYGETKRKRAKQDRAIRAACCPGNMSGECSCSLLMFVKFPNSDFRGIRLARKCANICPLWVLPKNKVVNGVIYGAHSANLALATCVPATNAHLKKSKHYIIDKTDNS